MSPVIPTKRIAEQGVSHLRSGNTNSVDNLNNAKFRSGASRFNKSIAGSAALQDLVVLLVASILVVAFSIFSGGLDVIEEWGQKNHLSALHIAEIVIVLVVLGIATTIFFIRRYQRLQEEILVGPESKQGSRSVQKRATLKDMNLQSLFYQVEAAKMEWERSLDSIKDMVIVSDLFGTIHRCNRPFKDFIDLPYDSIRNKNLISLLSNVGIELKELDLKDLNARLNIMGKWFAVKSHPYVDSETGNIDKVVITMHDMATNNASAKVQFLWGRSGNSRPDDKQSNR